jgi:hypothetical protein
MLGKSVRDKTYDDILINLYKIISQAGMGRGLETCLLMLAEVTSQYRGTGAKVWNPELESTKIFMTDLMPGLSPDRLGIDKESVIR